MIEIVRVIIELLFTIVGTCCSWSARVRVESGICKRYLASDQEIGISWNRIGYITAQWYMRWFRVNKYTLQDAIM